MGWNLRYRMLRTLTPGTDEQRFWKHIDEHHPTALLPVEFSFPEHVQRQIEERELVNELLVSENMNPRRYRNRVKVTAACRCDNCGYRSLAERQKPQTCSQCLTDLSYCSIEPALVAKATPDSVLDAVIQRPQRKRNPDHHHDEPVPHRGLLHGNTQHPGYH